MASPEVIKIPDTVISMSTNFEIIVVDDDKEDHQILFDFFKEARIGDKVHFITNGQLAMEYLEKIEQDIDLPRLIVLDLNMPILNGTQTLLQIKRMLRYKNIPVIILSTSENESEKRKCLSYGAFDYLVKPTTYEEGKEVVKVFASFVELEQ